ncbi:hypothetical protein [Gemmobacter sp. 24YEA27]|uniref:hypothetical protein n=1 Tax=Gemmobacter sp. 24YEA27 TaxID=3040672 RepID=UPI0024B3900D|nr:hypothetical protein [Gemmobacter sp. 24YEA27]
MTTGLAQADLIAVLAAVTGDAPRVMTVAAGEALPSGPFTSSHRSLQAGLRDWIESQTGHPVGFLEQLYTFADRDRGKTRICGASRSPISVWCANRRHPGPGGQNGMAGMNISPGRITAAACPRAGST